MGHSFTGSRFARTCLLAAVALGTPTCMFFRSLEDLTEPTVGSHDSGADGANEATASGARDAERDDGAPDGGTPVDAGSDGPTTDAAPLLGGPSLCSAAGLLFCNGFEEPLIDGGPWTAIAGTVSTDTTRAARGARSMHAHVATAAGLQSAYVAVGHSFAQPWKSLFVRSFVYVPSGQSAAVTGMVWAYFNGSGYAGADLGTTSTNHLRYRAPPDYVGKTSTLSLDVDRWVCLELEIFPVTTTTGGARAWVDGVALEVEGPGTVDTTNLDTVQLGIVTGSQEPAFDIWFDESAFDGARIGCAR